MIFELGNVSDMFEVSEWEGNTEQDRLISGLFGTKSLHVDQESKTGSLKDSAKKKKRKRRREESTDIKEEEKGEEQLGKQLEISKKDRCLKSTDFDEENGASNLGGKKRKFFSPPEIKSKSTLNESIGITSSKKRRDRRKKQKAEIENTTTKFEVDKKNENGKPKKNERYVDATKTESEQQKSIEVQRNSNTHKVKELPSKKSELQDKLKSKLDSSRFRWINEQLYTITGDEALELFNKDDSMFDVYHRGFRRQVEHWPVNPVDVMVEWIKQRPKSLIVADFGCGDATIAQSVPNKVHSFDLVAKNEWVTACNMAKVPLSSSSIDVAIFCLSLMGTDLESFIREAYRVLKPGGVLKIAEVVSRIIDVNTFIPSLCRLGFKMDLMDDSNKMFILMDFIKGSSTEKRKAKLDLSGLSLKPCIYKRR